MSSRERIVDLYRVLGVGRTATAAEVAAGYKAAARSAHPDAGGSHEQFLLVDLARRVLSDTWLRARYDSLLTVDTEIDAVRTAVAHADSPGEVIELLARCQASADIVSGLDGLRLPVELAAMVTELAGDLLAVIDDLKVRAERQAAATNSTSGGSSASTSPGFVDPESFFDEVVKRQLERLEAVLDRYREVRTDANSTTGTLQQQRSRLSALWSHYQLLRSYQELLRERRRSGHFDHLADEYRVLTALEDAVGVLRRRGEDLQRNYSTKTVSWLREQRRQVEAELRYQGTPIPDWRPGARPTADAGRASSDPNGGASSRSGASASPPRSDEGTRYRHTVCHCGQAAIRDSAVCWDHAPTTSRDRADSQSRPDRCAAVRPDGSGCVGQRRPWPPLCDEHDTARRNAQDQQHSPAATPDGKVESNRVWSEREDPPVAAGIVGFLVVALIVVGGIWVAARYFATDTPHGAGSFDIDACVAAMEQVSGAFDDEVDLAAALLDLEDSCRVPPAQPVSDQNRSTFNELADSSGELATCVERNRQSGLASTCTADLQRFVAALEVLAGPVKVLETPLATEI